MWTRVFIFLIGTVYVYQVITADIYVAEVMVESNATLEVETILSCWQTPLTLTVSGQTVTLEHRAVTTECVVIGLDYSCNCSEGHVWSNEMCYTYGCCNETLCTQNVSVLYPLCIPKVTVRLNGSIVMSSAFADKTKLKAAFESLNGLKDMNVTASSTSTTIGVFELSASVKFNTTKLQEIVDGLQTDLSPEAIYIDTHGMVEIDVPKDPVNYMSTQTLTCTFDEITGSAGWNLSTEFDRFELANGLLVKLKSNYNGQPSSVNVTLKDVTGISEGTYECGFTMGSIRHTARSEMKVALLPDEITLTTNPLVADCTDPSKKQVQVKATIPKTPVIYDIEWSYTGTNLDSSLEKTKNDTFIYTHSINIECMHREAHVVTVTFGNTAKQKKNASVDIPVIYGDTVTCMPAEDSIWPKSPAGSTVIIQDCPEGRVGYMSRTCDEGGQWQDVFSNCVNVELKRISKAAENFLNGLGATEKVALNIFAGMKNETKTNSNNDTVIADINASVDILDIMAKASKNIALQENLFPDLIDTASSMLNSTWRKVNDSVRYSISSKYLNSVENLVKNINVNVSTGFNSTNLELKFCPRAECNVTAFDIDVNLNHTGGILKVMAVKNLMDKLNNNFRETDRTNLLLSATLLNKSDSNITIKLAFPDEQKSPNQRYCVFWNTTSLDWSDMGCTVNTTDDNKTICECNHLTSFAVLMAKGEINDGSAKALDMITTVGLAVSICSLLIFLIIEYLVWSAVIKTNLSHFRHTAIVNIAFFRLLGDCSFLASSNPKILPDTWCLVLAVCKHLFYLAMFTWMLCLSCMLVHQLIFVFSPLRKRVFMFLSSILGYVLPMLLVGASYVYYKYTQKDYYNKKTCWLNYERLLVGSIHAFILPVGTIVLVNLFSMVVVIVTLMKTAVPDSSKSDEKETAKSILKVVVVLTPVFGVTWAIGFFLQMLEENNPMYKVAFYSFTILNSFQGLFILLTGCLAEQKVREELVKVIMKKTGHKSESTQKLTSATYTKEK